MVDEGGNFEDEVVFRVVDVSDGGERFGKLTGESGGRRIVGEAEVRTDEVGADGGRRRNGDRGCRDDLGRGERREKEGRERERERKKGVREGKRRE